MRHSGTSDCSQHIARIYTCCRVTTIVQLGCARFGRAFPAAFVRFRIYVSFVSRGSSPSSLLCRTLLVRTTGWKLATSYGAVVGDAPKEHAPGWICCGGRYSRLWCRRGVEESLENFATGAEHLVSEAGPVQPQCCDRGLLSCGGNGEEKRDGKLIVCCARFISYHSAWRGERNARAWRLRTMAVVAYRAELPSPFYPVVTVLDHLVGGICLMSAYLASTGSRSNNHAPFGGIVRKRRSRRLDSRHDQNLEGLFR